MTLLQPKTPLIGKIKDAKDIPDLIKQVNEKLDLVNDNLNQTIKDLTSGVPAIDVGQLTIAGDYTLPTADGSAEDVMITDGSGTVTWGGPKFHSENFTVTDGGGDITIDLPFDWTGGFVMVFRSTATGDWQADSTDMFEASYDSLTSGGYSSDQVFRHRTNSHDGVPKTNNQSGTPKAATTTSITFDDGGATIYCKIFVWA